MVTRSPWEIEEEAAEVIQAARDELIRQAAQGEVLHNDDTSMRVLHLARGPSDERTGVFTSGILGIVKLRQIFTIFKHARPTPGPQINKLAVVLGGETDNKFLKLTIP